MKKKFERRQNFFDVTQKKNNKENWKKRRKGKNEIKKKKTDRPLSTTGWILNAVSQARMKAERERPIHQRRRNENGEVH